MITEFWAQSSFITGIGYNDVTNTLKIEIKGTSYYYLNVSTTRWEELKNAKSYGSFYSKYIKGQYETSSSDVEYNNELPSDLPAEPEAVIV